MSGPAEVIILGEDNAHVGSIYRAIVDHLNVPRGKVRKLPTAGGCGDAKQFVLSQAPREIKLLRRGPRSTILIIAIDGDGISPRERLEELSNSLKNANTDQIDPSERIAVVVPCRNIETWREFARCEVVDEDKDYKHGRRAKWSGDDLAAVGRVLAQFPQPKENRPRALDEASARLRKLYL